MRAEQNERVTRIGPDTPCGQVLRHYWHPVALLDEFNPALDPRMGIRPVKAVKLLGQDLVLFKNAEGAFGLLDRDCPHRGADLAFGRNEGDGLRWQHWPASAGAQPRQLQLDPDLLQRMGPRLIDGLEQLCQQLWPALP